MTYSARNAKQRLNQQQDIKEKLKIKSPYAEEI